ncbi:hypothetical protein A4X20_19890 [Mycolicibacterium iranicum]|uniref:Uncharacterized protein n=1 Tax=Mycolicibacterium iranicum TaxID=912594 RepID=A0A178LWR0_MYCIR|nr:hypothetical protein A4X20_19890 [Mycolicibacterium iranicum]
MKPVRDGEKLETICTAQPQRTVDSSSRQIAKAETAIQCMITVVAFGSVLCRTKVRVPLLLIGEPSVDLSLIKIVAIDLIA